MQLAKDINDKKLSSRASQFDLSEHLTGLWELWLDLASSDRSKPAAFFRQLLLSMPTEPECPVVHVRRYLVDLLDRGDSPLLHDLDGEHGLFEKLTSYGASLGMKDEPPSLHVMAQAGAPAPAGGGKKRERPKSNNPCCNAFACPGPSETIDGLCICDAKSQYPLSKIENTGRREFVKLVRRYSKANPGKSLKVSVRLIKEAVGGTSAGNTTASTEQSGAGSMAFMAPVTSVLGNEISDKAALDRWLAEHNDDQPGFYMLGDITGDGELQFAVVDDPTQQQQQQASAAAETPLEATSGSSYNTAPETDPEVARLRAALEVAEIRNRELEAQSAQHQRDVTPATAPRQTAACSAAATPGDSSNRPNLSLDRPTPFSVNMTPRELYARWQSSPQGTTPAPSRGGRQRQPLFSIGEADATPVGGANNNADSTAAELLGRGIVAMQDERRKLKNKLGKGKLTLSWLLRASARLVAAASRSLAEVVAMVIDWAGDLSLHQLLTVALFTYAVGHQRLGSAVLMAANHDMDLSKDLLPALMDDGASKGTSCCRSLEGAIPGTLRSEDACKIGLGSDGATLESLGSHLYALERFGADSSEVVLRRMKHTPNLPVAMVFSEATENIQHGYGIYWDPGQPRVLKSPNGVTLKLFMSSSELGWLKVRPIRSASEVRSILSSRAGDHDAPANANSMLSVKTLDPSAVRTVGMGSVKSLKGVALLRRRHCTDGHPALAITVKNLRLEGAFDDGRLTLKDVELFAAQGCGSCELAKMRRRAFTIKVEPDDPTPPALGKTWTFDVLELRVPCAHSGATYIGASVEKVSKLGMGGRMRGYSENDVSKALNELRARVRPNHGEILITRMDSHPSHRSRHVRQYHNDDQLRQQLSPPFVHEGVGDIENFFLHQVPAANAMLVAAPDLGEEHFCQALMYTMVAKNHSVTSGSSPPRSPAMVYFGSDKFLPSHLHVFGCEGKALVHGEARETKFDDHAKPCIYMGPAVDSDSRAHCAVLPVGPTNRYVDIDVGCAAFYETTVIDRTRRDHPSTQPFNRVAAPAAVDVGKPSSIFDLVGTDCSTTELPEVQPIVWVRSMPTPTEFFVVLMWHGDLRPGDMLSWVYELGASRLVALPIELNIGGQEHNTSRKVVKSAVIELHEHDSCVGGFMQPECGRFSASRFKQPGPPVLFNSDFPDGIPDEAGELDPEVLIALSDVALVAKIFRTSSGNGKVLMLEFPAGQGEGSPYAAKGREKHSTIMDTSLMQAVIEELKLEVIFTEQGAAGADSRKPTIILSTVNGAHALRRAVGTLRVSDAAAAAMPAIVGQAADGSYNTRPSHRYTPQFAMLLAIALVGSILEIISPHGAVQASAGQPATDDIFPVGTRVEVWWYANKVWYRGTVLDSKVRKGKVHGVWIPRREVLVRYDADDAKLWHTLCDNSIREVANEENEPGLALLEILADRRERLRPDDLDASAASSLFLLDSDVLDSLTAAELVSRIANLTVANRRACTSFAEPLDEANACNALPRIDLYRGKLLKITGSAEMSDTLIGKAIDEYTSRYTDEEWAQMAAERSSWLMGGGAASSPSHDGSHSALLASHAGEIFIMRQVLLDLQSGEAHDPERVLAVLSDSTVVDVDYSKAHGWHVPRNEREYNASPQRDLWRTAKELKMDDYRNVDMFDLVLESSVDKSKFKIYDTLWVHKIKFKDGGLVFDKLSPRWCVKGGSMDRDLYKSFAEMMRSPSLHIMWGLKAMYYDLLCAILFDLKDAFQATSTVDGNGELLPGQQELYTHQAPGFVQYGPNGERLVCRQKCFMQGRIDATAGFDGRIVGILTESAHFKPTLWDPKIFIFHNTIHAGTTAPLDVILREGDAIVKEGRDSAPQLTPMGWGMIGQHVDDMQSLATGLLEVENNRILSFTRGEIATVYACKLTGWHGRKMLGFDITLNDVLKTVYISAQGTYEALRSKIVTKDTIRISPKHIVTEAVYESSPGDVPSVGHPDRTAYLSRQSLTRSVLGGGIWLSQAYPQIISGINAMCADMANPSDARLAQLRHMFMFLGETPRGKTFGGAHVSSPLHSDTEIKPFTSGVKAGYFHFFSDASINVTGGVAMFAGCAIQGISLRQHLQSPNAHTSELVAGGTNISSLITINGLLQELSVRRGIPTFMYFDSKSTVFVASSDAAAKKSVWLARRNKVITEAVQFGEARPVHIPECDMVADSFTKYVKHAVWERHMHYILNMPGDPPPAPAKA